MLNLLFGILDIFKEAFILYYIEMKLKRLFLKWIKLIYKSLQFLFFVILGRLNYF